MTALPLPPPPTTQRERNRLARLAANPRALSLESLFALVDDLEAAAAELPEDARTAVGEYARAVRQWGVQRRDAYVTQNMGLVGQMVYGRYREQIRAMGLDPEDFVQEGSIGLNKAALLYDPSKGWLFTTYAVYWIWQSVQCSLQNAAFIRVPVYLSAERARRSRGEKPRKAKDRKHEECLRAAGQAMSVLSLDREYQGLTDVSPRTIMDKVTDNGAGEREILRVDNRRDVEGLLACLHERERQVIEMRYFEDKTLAECGHVLGVTRERVRQLVGKALERLRRMAEWQAAGRVGT